MSEQVFAAVASSNMTGHEKSVIRRYLDRYTGGSASRYLDQHNVGITKHSAMSAFRQGGESLGTGTMLGAVNGTIGLDFGPIPLDFSAGLVGMLIHAFVPSAALSPDLGNVSASFLTVFGFRKMDAYMKQRKLLAAGTTSMHGESDDMGAEDPIIAEARNL